MGLDHIQVSDNTFDVILCNHVLEHVPDDRTAMAELYRVLKPQGWAIIQVPIKGDTTFEEPTVTNPRDRERLFGQWDHVRIYGRDYRERLASAGFKVSVVAYAQTLPRNEIRRMALMGDENIYFCRKV